jgi:MORN repeat
MVHYKQSMSKSDNRFVKLFYTGTYNNKKKNGIVKQVKDNLHSETIEFYQGEMVDDLKHGYG